MAIRGRCYASLLVFAFAWPRQAQADEPLQNGLTDTHATGGGQTLEPNQVRSIPLFSVEQRGGAAGSFESLGLFMPGVREDQLGVSFGGASSLENTFYIDGIRMNDPMYGHLALPLGIEFVKNVDIRLSGADATFGRGLGGVYDVAIREGTDAWHLSTWSTIAPGDLEGQRARVPFPNKTIEMQKSLSRASNVGFNVGGPLIPNRLYFFGGGQFTQRRYQLDRSLFALNWVPDPSCEFEQPCANQGRIEEIDPATGLQRKTQLPGMDETYYAVAESIQWLGKLSYRPTSGQEWSLTIVGQGSGSGGNGDHAIDPLKEAIDLTNLYGTYGALGRTESTLTNAVILRGSRNFPGGSTRIDTALGWVFGHAESGAADGSGLDDIGTPGTLAHVPSVTWRKNSSQFGKHVLSEFENLTPEALEVCARNGDLEMAQLNCPVSSYNTGGPAFLSKSVSHRLEGRAVVSTRFFALGEHRVRAGIDFELATLSYSTGYGGAVRFEETSSGNRVWNRSYGGLSSPSEFVIFESVTNHGVSFDVGGFISDTWSVRKNIIVEAALRYDAQFIRGMEPKSTLVLPDMVSPRFGFSWDPSAKGWFAIQANYGMRYQTVPLNLAVRALSSNGYVERLHEAESCNLNRPELHYMGCTEGLVAVEDILTSPHPNFSVSESTTAIAPSVHAPAAHQFSLGGNVLLPGDVRFHAIYLRNDIIRALEDVDDGDGGLILGNPGTSRATAALAAVREYDGFAFAVTRPFANGLFVMANYNYSWLRGNYAGQFNPESGQIDPNVNSDFDTPMQNINRHRDLAGDERHAIKVYAGKEFRLPAGISLDIGGAYAMRSGLPIQALGADGAAGYGSAMVYLIEPNTRGRTSNLHRFDMHFGAGLTLRKDVRLSMTADVFNLLNAQTVVAVNQNYTYDDVLLDKDGRIVSPEIVDKNPSYRKPTAYQAPRQVRLGLRLDY